MATKSRRMREKEQVILLEGKRLISDAINSGVTIKSIYFDKLEGLEGIDIKAACAPLYKMRSSHLKIWSDVVVSQGVMGMCWYMVIIIMIQCKPSLIYIY